MYSETTVHIGKQYEQEEDNCRIYTIVKHIIYILRKPVHVYYHMDSICSNKGIPQHVCLNPDI